MSSDALPLMSSQLGISSAEFGLVVSALALSKMLGNLPAAVAVDRWGRKHFLTLGTRASFDELHWFSFL